MRRPGGKPTLEEFGDVFEPKEAAEPILGRIVRDALTEWLTEIWAEDELREVGVAPRRRAIFGGLPGVGKTTLAHHLAARLGLRMVAVRPDRLIDSWVGSTGRNIGALFDAAQEATAEGAPVVLLLDEFDAVAIKRREARQGAEDERNAWVNTLLQRIDQYTGILIAATNFPQHLDQAIWRRFDIHIDLELPAQPERERILARYLLPYRLRTAELSQLAVAFETAAPSLMRQFCEGIKRHLIIGPKCGWSMRRDDVIERIVATVHPHPDLGKPRLWSHGSRDQAIVGLGWPLSTELQESPDESAAPTQVVRFPASARGGTA